MRSDTRQRMKLSGVDLSLLGIAALFMPASVLAENLVGIAHPGIPLAFVALVWLVSVSATLAAIRMGAGRIPSVHVVFAATVMFMSGGIVLRQLGSGLGVLTLLVLLALSVYLFAWLGDGPFTRASMIGIAVFLISGPTINLANSVLDFGESSVVSSEAMAVEMVETPDVFLVVLDGYPGAQSLLQDSMAEPGELAELLRGKGFQVPDSAWTAYWSTRLSVPSLLDMSYPVVDDSMSKATTGALYSVVSGPNSLLTVLNSNGYRSTMLESGWSGGACGPAYDRCVHSQLFDETMALILKDTAIGPWLISQLGSPFTIGAERTMAWLLENAGVLSASPQPDFVFAHVLAPHPPFYLDGSCERVVTKDRSGLWHNRPGVNKAERDGYFAEQLQCVDGFISQLADIIEPEDVLVFVGDHGTDSRYQLAREAEEWGEEGITERMNVFLAVRTGGDCEISRRIMVPNVVRQVLNCSRLPVSPICNPACGGEPLWS